MANVGFKRMTIRVLDGAAAPTVESNLFVIEGKEGKGATQTAKITGLAIDPVKTYGSDAAYHISNRGIGDTKVELTTVDIPRKVRNAILGYQTEGNIVRIGAETVAPYCSILLESRTASGEPVYLGFYKGQFSLDNLELETIKDKQEELASDALSFTPIASDATATAGDYITEYVGTDQSEVNKLKGRLNMTAAG